MEKEIIVPTADQLLAKLKLDEMPIGKDPSKAIAVQTKEELKTVDPKLQEAYAKLSEGEKIQLQRGYKTWKTNGKSEYVLVDNIPFARGLRGTNFTPKKKKRKK